MKFGDRIRYGLLYGISLLPLWILYRLSDFLAFLIYFIVGYRKEIVLANLKTAFPERSEEEIREIAKRFYLNFTDTLIESIKLISSGEDLIKRMFIFRPEVMQVFEGAQKNIQIHAMHNFNWEIINLGVSREMKLPFLGVYQPIINPFFESLFRKIRTRYGTILLPANDFKNNFIPHQGKQYVLALVADQNPGNPAKAWWANFFGKPAPFVKGPEQAARARDTVVVFANFYKIKRGVYTFEAEKFTDNPMELQPGELTLKYIQYVEKKVRERPDNYLWSHRRWKHPFKTEYANDILEKLNL